ncbi:MAG: transposase [Candidatus Krumholzibacteriota bacterium]|nr:transposase [Candidatus Krumholzibacteriota bacterium]
MVTDDSVEEIVFKPALSVAHRLYPQGVVAVTSDDHKGIRAALSARLTGVLWQRCRFLSSADGKRMAR